MLDPAGRRRWPIVRVIAWTAAWMAFEWWAVIGWPDALEVRPAALMMGGVVTLVGLAVWRDVREPTSEPAGARIVPLRRTLPGVAVAVEESAEAELDAAA